MKKIAFIGAGKMAEALISKLEAKIIVADIKKSRLSYLKKKYKTKIAKNNQAAFELADIVVLAVKPQDIDGVVAKFTLPKKAKQALQLQPKKIIISIAAGIELAYLQKMLPGFAIVRAMPNNPCLVGMGITALAKGKLVSAQQFKLAQKIFQAVGEVVIIPEKWMHAVTGLSGSGPAFIYLMIEALVRGGISEGLPKPLALKLALHTVLGSAATIIQTGKSPQELAEMVASPGGTTIEGLKVLKQHKHSKAIAKAVGAAAKKSRKLSKNK